MHVYTTACGDKESRILQIKAILQLFNKFPFSWTFELIKANLGKFGLNHWSRILAVLIRKILSNLAKLQLLWNFENLLSNRKFSKFLRLFTWDGYEFNKILKFMRLFGQSTFWAMFQALGFFKKLFGNLRLEESGRGRHPLPCLRQRLVCCGALPLLKLFGLFEVVGLWVLFELGLVELWAFFELGVIGLFFELIQ